MRFATICESRHNNSVFDDDKYPHRDIGLRLQAIRESTGLNPTEFTELIGVNYTRYLNWESGQRRLLPDEAIKLCEKFDVSLDFIYRGILSALPEKILKAWQSISRDKA